MSNWTAEEEATMKQMWEVDGASASQIARAIGRGCTRNVVIGIVHRRKWQLHALPTGNQRANRSKPMQHLRGPKAPKPQPWKAEATREEIHNLEPYGPANDIPAAGQCRYIRDEPGQGTWACCGYPTGDRDQPDNREGDSTKSYCDAHMVIMRVPGSAYSGYTRRGPKASSAVVMFTNGSEVSFEGTASDPLRSAL